MVDLILYPESHLYIETYESIPTKKAMCNMLLGSTLIVRKIAHRVRDKMFTEVEKSQDRNVEEAKNLTNIFIFLNLGTHMGLRLFMS